MEYKIKNVQERDEWNGQYGPMKTYAIALEGETGWHQLNQKLQTPPPREGDTITGFIEDKVTKNGAPYKKFVKQNPKFASQQSSSSSIPNDLVDKVDYIIDMLESLTGTEREKKDDDYDKPMTAEDIPDVFNDPFEGTGV